MDLQAYPEKATIADRTASKSEVGNSLVASKINEKNITCPQKFIPKFISVSKLVGRTVLTGLLVGLLWLQGFWTGEATALSNPIKEQAVLAQFPLNGDEVRPITPDRKRSQAIAECIPGQLTASNKDVLQRIMQALGEMGNDQLERALGFTDNPKLSKAEKEFESCMRSKGFLPQREMLRS